MHFPTIFIFFAFVLAGTSTALPLGRNKLLLARFTDSDLLARVYDEPELYARGIKNSNMFRKGNQQSYQALSESHEPDVQAAEPGGGESSGGEKLDDGKSKEGHRPQAIILGGGDSVPRPSKSFDLYASDDGKLKERRPQAPKIGGGNSSGSQSVPMSSKSTDSYISGESTRPLTASSKDQPNTRHRVENYDEYNLIKQLDKAKANIARGKPKAVKKGDHPPENVASSSSSPPLKSVQQ